MRYSGLTVVLIGICVLCMTACVSSRTATSVSSRDRVATYETRDSMEVVERSQQESLVEITTITIDRNDAGDTLRVTQIIDRLRARDRNRIAKQMTKTEVKTDTVYVERRDSVATNGKYGGGQSGGTALHSTLKLIFLIVISLIVLVIVLKFRRI